MTNPPVITVLDAAPMDRASYPIDFALLDDDGLAVLAIADDPSEHHAHLELTNTSGADILFDPPDAGTVASADRYHFEVRFRPGVLSAVSADKLSVADQDGWSATGPQRQPDGTVSLYLLCTGLRSLSPATPVRLLLNQISADGTGGARGTQVELRMQGLRYADGTPLADLRLIHVDLVNQRGQKNIPLHVGFAGSHSVLNDGVTKNTLTVRITNVSSANLTLGGLTGAAPSTFILSFDSGKTWGLATPDALAACTLDAIDGANLDEADWVVAPGRQLGKDLAWTLTHKKDSVLAPGQVIQLTVGNIVTALPSGDTNLYLRYENIPGYWDGQFVCTLEKGPIHYDDRGNVGVGTASPARPLQVGDDVKGVGLEPTADGPCLRFGDQSGRKLRIARSRESAGGALNTRATGALVTVKDTGQVGVGTDDPASSLTVRADSASSKDARQILVQGGANASDQLTIGYHTGSDYGSIQAVTQGTGARPLLLNPLGGGVTIGLQDTPGTALLVNGAIRSPMWQAASLMQNQSGPLPVKSGVFTTSGGTVLLFVHGTGWRRNPGGLGLMVRIDSGIVDELIRFVSVGNQHYPIDGTMVKTGLPAGNHTLTVDKLSDAPDMLTDTNDFFGVTLLELPF
ncbi:hypothetical protein [Rugosimonospora africana]|uniref:Uncharacterized protein n=1 Tax=Rugosimonospora africana TaxID=556532 RepID=A0A8J3VR32_9ACTN|nr:hypothetical protein [Rugosimonospora africana]GIH15131.1 hypothetical protein Raf01_33030 [Rugosimonospora africana]